MAKLVWYANIAQKEAFTAQSANIDEKEVCFINTITIFLEQYGQLISLVVSCLMLLLLFIKTKDKKYLEEVKDLIKYRTNNQTASDFVPQSFDNYKPVYRLNKATNTLELTDEVIDIQELVNSCKEVALNAVLDRFLPSFTATEEAIAVAKMEDDVDKIRDALSTAEFYRVKYNLSQELSANEIFDTISKKSIELKNKIEEVSNNEKKKNDEESK